MNKPEILGLGDDELKEATDRNYWLDRGASKNVAIVGVEEEEV